MPLAESVQSGRKAAKVKDSEAAATDRRTVLPQTPAAEATFWGKNLDAAVKELGVFAHFVEITADLAQCWLKRNHSNRQPSASVIERYARDMAAGQWLFNSQAITFSKTGRLLNGQNRLLACVRAGIPFQSLVIYGLPEDSFINEDNGRKRSRKDRLDIQKVERSNLMSGAIGWFYGYERTRLSQSNMGTPTPAEEQDILKRHPKLANSVAMMSRSVFNAVGNQGMFAMLHYVMCQRDETLADAFFDGLASGGMIRESDPVFQLRKRFLENRASNRKLTRTEAAALTIKAWNYHRHGRDIKILSWRANQEPFPEIE